MTAQKLAEARQQTCASCSQSFDVPSAPLGARIIQLEHVRNCPPCEGSLVGLAYPPESRYRVERMLHSRALLEPVSDPWLMGMDQFFAAQLAQATSITDRAQRWKAGLCMCRCNCPRTRESGVDICWSCAAAIQKAAHRLRMKGESPNMAKMLAPGAHVADKRERALKLLRDSALKAEHADLGHEVSVPCCPDCSLEELGIADCPDEVRV